MVLDICRDNGIPSSERNLSLTELYTADEVFTTGTMGELTPVLEADGRTIGNGSVGETTRRLQKLHREVAFSEGEEITLIKGRHATHVLLTFEGEQLGDLVARLQADYIC